MATKNDESWRLLFESKRVLEQIEANGICRITAADINYYREARLMTKFDHQKNLPQIFTKHGLTILPVAKGDYLIAGFDVYVGLQRENISLAHVPIPGFISSIDFSNISSEAISINAAFISNIYQDFIGEEELYPTVNGRMSSTCFNFQINNCKTGRFDQVAVSNVQLEIDAGFESDNSLVLVEAKNSISDDFIIRQLYYPYRLWENRISKKVRNVFQEYSNGFFYLYEYEFEDKLNYNSLKLIR
jgi:hypothetical protein